MKRAPGSSARLSAGRPRTPGRRGRPGRRGFTLVEMLIVVSIVMLLAGMMVPVIQSVVASALDTSCAINLRGLANGLKQYTVDFRCFPYVRNDIGRNTTNAAQLNSEYQNYWKAYIIFDRSSGTHGWLNLGLLWSPKRGIYPGQDADGRVVIPKGKYLASPDHFWCPKFDRKDMPAGLWKYYDSRNPWPPKVGWHTRATYYRRPAASGKYPDKIPDRAAIAADVFPRTWDPSYLPEHVHKNGDGLHVGYYSGQVDWFDDPGGELAEDPRNFVGGTDRESARLTEQSWQRLDKADVPWDAANYLP